MHIKGKKKLLLWLIFAVLAAILISRFFIRAHQDHMAHLVDYAYDVETGIVTFTIDDEYCIFSLKSINGYLEIPKYDEDTSFVIFSSWDIPANRNEFLHFKIQSKENPSIQYIFEYEINHGDETMIEAFDYLTRSRVWQYYNCECPIHKWKD